MVIVLARNWWALVLRGLLDVLFGIAAFAWPGITLRCWCSSTVPFALVDGVFAIAAAVVGRPRGCPGGPCWWRAWLGIAVGVMTFFWPGITALALLYLIAAWAVVTGVFEIVAAIRLRKEIRGEWLLALSGVLSVAVRRGPGRQSRRRSRWRSSWMIGAYAIAFGVLFIVLGFRLRSWRDRESGIAVPPSGEPTTATSGFGEPGAIATSSRPVGSRRRERAGARGVPRPSSSRSTPVRQRSVDEIPAVQVGGPKGGPPWQKVRRSSASTWGRPTASSR